MASAQPDYLPDHERVLPRLDRWQTGALFAAVPAFLLTGALGVVELIASGVLSLELQTAIYICSLLGLLVTLVAIYAPFFRRGLRRWAPGALSAAAITCIVNGGWALFILARVTTDDRAWWSLLDSAVVLLAGVALIACGSACAIIAPRLVRR